MKKILICLFVLILLAVVAATGVGIWWTQELKAPSTSNKTQTVLITKGSNASTIATKLKEAGVIKNDLVFRLYVRFTKSAANLPVGEFLIPSNLTVPQVIAFLQKGPQEVWVTIPEGLRREEYPERFTAALGYTGTQSDKFIEEFLNASEGSEGYLFPETYLVPKEVSAARAVSLLKNTFDKKIAPLGALTKADVILASLVERETRIDSERPTIAGILKNRIAIGMPLQVDATVQYAKANLACRDICDEWWPTVYLDDYKLTHPYNTYVIAGLPPQPIANPGLESLKAVVNPEPSDYLFYIHDLSGKAHYATTLDEHNANVQKYLR